MSTLKEFSENLYIFHENATYQSIETLYKKAVTYFEAELDKVDEREFLRTKIGGNTAGEKKNNLKSWIKEITDKINKIVERKSENDMTASMDFYKLMFKEDGTGKYTNMLTDIDRNTDFYRMRRTDKYERFDRGNMFLISDNLEHLVGDYRFNPSGYACLYLAPNLFLAWEECRRPDFDKVNFARFVNTRAMKVLNVTISRDMHYKGDYLMAYLTLLCCAKTTDQDKHNFQYVVPHLMMEVLCHSQRQAKNHNKQIIHGIKYLSSRRFDQKDFLFHDKRLCEAYVFPQHHHDDPHKICPFLANLFYFTESRTFFLYKSHCLNFFQRTALVSRYQESLFYQLEILLKNDKVEKYIEPNLIKMKTDVNSN